MIGKPGKIRLSDLAQHSHVYPAQQRSAVEVLGAERACVHTASATSSTEDQRVTMDNITGVIKQYKCILRIDEPYQTNLQKPLAPNMRASSKQSWATVYVHPSSSAGLKSQNIRKAGWTFFSLCIVKQSVSETMMCCTSTGLESSCFVISVQRHQA